MSQAFRVPPPLPTPVLHFIAHLDPVVVCTLGALETVASKNLEPPNVFKQKKKERGKFQNQISLKGSAAVPGFTQVSRQKTAAQMEALATQYFHARHPVTVE